MADTGTTTSDPTEQLSVETWYDRRTRSWVSRIVNGFGTQLGVAEYNGTRADRDASVCSLQLRIDDGRALDWYNRQ